MPQTKISKLAQSECFCCVWAFLEAHKHTNTSELYALARAAGFEMSARTIRVYRRAYRRKQLECAGAKNCMLNRVSGKTP